MKPLTRAEQSAKLRTELTKELLGSPSKKRGNKSTVAIQKKDSKKSKFLSNPNNRPEKGETKNGSKMNKCEHPKYRKEKRESSISASKVMGERE